MLVHVSVKDILLLEAAEVDLGPGLTVLTGQTGAGKSILVEALLLLLGARASADVVRTGADEGSVQAQLELAGEELERVAALLAEAGLPPMEDGALILRRVISREGRHKQLVNGALVTVAQMKAIADPLVDFTGQHAHQQLLRPGAQLALLDAFAENDRALGEMARAHDAAKAIAEELRALRAQDAEKQQRLDLVRFYLEEIDTVAPQPGEDEALAAEHKRLRNAGRLAHSLAEVQQLLAGGDDALERLQHASQALARAAQDDDALRPIRAQLEEAVAIVDDVARTLQRKQDIEADPERLSVVEDRLEALKRLMKKHGGDVAHVLVIKDQLAGELASIEGASARIAELEIALGSAVDRATELADKLTARRRASAKKLAAAVEGELPSLGMPGARFEVRVAPLAAHEGAVVVRADRVGLSRAGSDRVELAFSANPGEELASFAKVASGGELSRVLLAVKRAVLAKDPVPTSIFDEIDAGVGGAIADAIGEKLSIIAGDRQVLCITHVPQIAARADRHIVVEKAVAGGRSVSRVRALSDDERVHELSRMLGGKVVTEASRRHAEDMLGRARRDKKKPARRKSA